MKRRPQPRLGLERLEARDMPAVFGTPWPDPQHLTVSFAPDATLVGSQPSRLSAALGAHLSTSAWQTALLRAVEVWASQGNVNVTFTTDTGAPFGAGPAQGAPGYGDIRFGAVALSSNEVAVATPYQATLGSWSGDVVFNTNAPFGDGTNGTYDLFTVALHEVGHAFGLDDGNTPGSVMYHDYLGTRTGLSAQDVAAFRALYGARPPEAVANDTVATATVLAAGKKSPAGTTGDLGTVSDVDYYRFTASAGAMTVSLQTAGVSLLTGGLTVLDASNRVIGDVSNADPMRQSPLWLSVPLTQGQRYYVRVRGAGTAFDVGAYQLTISTPRPVLPAHAKRDDDAGRHDTDAGANGDPVAVGPAGSADFSAANFPTVGTATLNQSRTQAAWALTANRTGLYQFALGVTGTQRSAGVRMTILDANGVAVATCVAVPGQAVSVNVWLAQGGYTIIYAAGTGDGSALQNLFATLGVAEASDAIDPYPIDPTSSPTSSTPTTWVPPPSGTTTGLIAPPPATPTDPAYLSVSLWGPSFLTPTSPYSNPYWY